MLAAREPMWLRTCVLLDKPSRRVVEISADYVGFEVPDQWIIGYGLDAAARVAHCRTSRRSDGTAPKRGTARKP